MFTLNARQRALVEIHKPRFFERAQTMGEVMDIGFPGVKRLDNGDILYMLYHGPKGFQYASPATGRVEMVEVDPEVMAAGEARLEEYYAEQRERSSTEFDLSWLEPESKDEGFEPDESMAEKMGWRLDHPGFGHLVDNDPELMKKFGLGDPSKGERALSNPFGITAAKMWRQRNQ